MFVCFVLYQNCSFSLSLSQSHRSKLTICLFCGATIEICWGVFLSLFHSLPKTFATECILYSQYLMKAVWLQNISTYYCLFTNWGVGGKQCCPWSVFTKTLFFCKHEPQVIKYNYLFKRCHKKENLSMKKKTNKKQIFLYYCKTTKNISVGWTELCITSFLMVPN